MKCTVEMELPFLVLCLFGTGIAFLGGKAGQQLTPAAAIAPRKSNTGLEPVTSDLVLEKVLWGSGGNHWRFVMALDPGDPGRCRGRRDSLYLLVILG